MNKKDYDDIINLHLKAPNLMSDIHELVTFND